jgi:3,4-dihydroxy-2-butanone 4-phosphate synthase
MMVPKNTEKHKTAYTVTVDYKQGTTTGISAHDRALTARMLAKSAQLLPQHKVEGVDSKEVPQPEEFSRPGHMVPLRYTEGGVRVRKGHTEASVDLCRACSLPPVALLCELVDPASSTGSIAARDACLAFAKEHNLKVITIEALKQWREAKEGKDHIPELGACNGTELDEQRGIKLIAQQVAEPAAALNTSA